MIHGYTHVLTLSHKELEYLWEGTVYGQEKIDGSQISFGRDAVTGHLSIRSRNAEVDTSDPGMFNRAVDTIVGLPLRWGWVYRGEYLSKPKHNTLCYDRVPKGNVILFDVDRGNQDYLKPFAVREEALHLGLEVVPTLFEFGSNGPAPSIGFLLPFLDMISVLGGVKVEGIVCKNYAKFGSDGKVLMGKLVRDDFKEVHKTDWKVRNPSPGDFVEKVAEKYHSEARWRKAVQHLAEAGGLQRAPQDIPALLKEVGRDVLEECGEEIAQEIFRYYWKRSINRIVTKGLPEWYKEWLKKGE